MIVPSVGRLKGGGDFFDSSQATEGASRNLLGRWKTVDSSSVFSINFLPAPKILNI
jgi:hypothetical protein